MRFTCEREPLLAALSFVARYVEQRSNIPILADILFEASDGYVAITGTDLDRVARDRFVASIEDGGRICIPGHLLLKAVKDGSGSEVQIDADDAWASVRIGKARLKLPVLPAADFPMLDMASAETKHSFTLPGETLSEIAARVTFAREKDGSRFYLAGTSWRFEQGRIELCATDGKRMPVMSVSADAPATPDIIVPDFPLPAWSDAVTVEMPGHSVRFRCGDQMVASKLIEGTFPDYHRVIPNGNGARLLFDRAELLAAANRCGLVADVREHSILIVGRDGVAVLSAVTTSGEISDEVAYDGDDFQIAIQHSVLSSVLATFDCENIEIRWQSHDVGVTAHDLKDGRRLVVMQPYRDRRIAEYITVREAAE